MRARCSVLLALKDPDYVLLLGMLRDRVPLLLGLQNS